MVVETSPAPRARRRRRVAKPERLDARVSREQKKVIERAASLVGRSVTDFVVTSAQEKAEETIRKHEMMSLTVRDSVTFVEALLDPPEPNERLRAGARRYREFVGE